MIAVIQLGKEFGHDAVRQAVDSAVTLGCSDSAAIRYLLTCAGQRRPVLEVAEIGALTRYDRPLPCLRGYDRLLAQDQEVAPCPGQRRRRPSPAFTSRRSGTIAVL